MTLDIDRCPCAGNIRGQCPDCDGPGFVVIQTDPDHRCRFPTGRQRRKQRIRVIECVCGQQWRWSETYAGDGWVKA